MDQKGPVRRLGRKKTALPPFFWLAKAVHEHFLNYSGKTASREEQKGRNSGRWGPVMRKSFAKKKMGITSVVRGIPIEGGKRPGGWFAVG